LDDTQTKFQSNISIFDWVMASLVK